jgi:hypothetical protein
VAAAIFLAKNYLGLRDSGSAPTDASSPSDRQEAINLLREIYGLTPQNPTPPADSEQKMPSNPGAPSVEQDSGQTQKPEQQR